MFFQLSPSDEDIQQSSAKALEKAQAEVKKLGSISLGVRFLFFLSLLAQALCSSLLCSQSRRQMKIPPVQMDTMAR